MPAYAVLETMPSSEEFTRHLAGTLTAQAGATVRETMDRLGHSTSEASMRYQHVATERRGQIA